MNIDKKQMDEAWKNRDKSDQFLKYIYEIASFQVNRKGISHEEKEDYIQFAVMKCFSHQNSFNPSKGSSYSFFWKQISLAIIYKQRKQARKKSKIKTYYVDQEKVLDWAEQKALEEEGGQNLSEIVDIEEAIALRKAFKKYNSNNKSSKATHDKSSAIKVLKWMEDKQPGFIDNNFSTLKWVFKSWIA